MTEPQRDIKAVFIEAIELPSPQDRAKYLDEACRNNDPLRAGVDELLRAHDDAGKFLAGAQLPSRIDRAITEGPGTVIGPFTLLKQIGEGGFGVVFLAEQTIPLRRQVALKVLKPGMDTWQVVTRFEAERQVLAILDHPNIARVLDGGVTTAGRPYFVMDLVDGLPITEYSDQHHLTSRERLELFVSVCHAVQHAHHKGIIHRDLKPSNVLVATRDSSPMVKVIDFGVAKAMGQTLTDKTLITGFAQMIGSPLYMSPEQAGQSSLDIDTRSDIYSLGVLLYEMLTGTTPFEKERFQEATYDEILRIVREEDPPKPSARISTLGQAATTFAANRQCEPHTLDRLCQGELDWIVMKALEKDRNRRYETANAFAMDVQRYLSDEPVHACPPSRSYRLRKFIRRNKGSLIAVASVLLALTIGIVGTTVGLIRADQQRRIAQSALKGAEIATTQAEESARSESRQKAVAIAQRNVAVKARQRTREALDAMTSSVVASSLVAQDKISPEQKKFLDEVLTYYQEFAGESADDDLSRRQAASAAYRVGFIEFRLGHLEQSVTAFQRACEAFAALASDFPTEPKFRHDLARCHNHLGILFRMLEKHTESAQQYNKAMANLVRLDAEDPHNPAYYLDMGLGHFGLGTLLAARRQRADSEKQFREALRFQEFLVDKSPANPERRQEFARTLTSLGILLNDLGRHDEAEDYLRNGLDHLLRLTTEFPSVTTYRQELGTTYNGIGMLLHDRKQDAQAVDQFHKSLALRMELAKALPVSPAYRQELARTHDNLGVALNSLGNRTEAEQHFKNALIIRQQLVQESPKNPVNRHDLGCSQVNLAILFHGLQKHSEAEQQFQEGLTLLTALVQDYPGIPNYRQRQACGNAALANLLKDLGNYAEAARRFQNALLIQEELAVEFPDESMYRKDLARSLKGLGNLLLVVGQPAEESEPFRTTTKLHHRLVNKFPDPGDRLDNPPPTE